MNGRAIFLLVTNFGIALAIQDFPLNFDDMIVYAKPGSFIHDVKIDAIDNEDLAINCGKTRRIWLTTPYKISIGSAAKLGQFPWAVALTFLNVEQYNYCGGTIISKRHILTAAHCVMRFASSHLPCSTGASLESISDIVVRYGGICLRTGSPPCDGKLCMTAEIRKVAFHRR
ncbi:unnamed protein product [Onchocerca flexuosa]|uniref:Peptidase S1 domain-containing protein n=1 Tax=Onchocerca flexuosa TaxID=387005 RepID=A0A183HJF4_9BILA|nr:unnamed protein product [Onchocerca flexuosa]